MPTSGITVATAAAAVNGGTGGIPNAKKFGEPLFGPSIGSVSSGPSWTASTEKKTVTDELTQETINGWIEKSKQPSNPTTTLQALVNLKRPTLRLSPLSTTQDDGVNPATSEQLHLHGLEFVYDCDAPKCGIYVNVVLPRNHPDAPQAAAVSQTGFGRLQVFELIQGGGFGNKLTIEDGAVLELGRFEHGTDLSPAVNNQPEASQLENLSNERKTTNEGVNGIHRKRFSHFHFRKRRSVSGPALAVVDAERSNSGSTNALQPDSAGAGEGKVKPSKHKDDDGVKVIIRLVALDEQETELASPNEQTTYLHIVRFGSKPEVKEEGEKDKVEDSRPWVVKVVKREATIGPHTFHLHEIYGLTSSSTALAAPTVPPSHTYPPDPSGNVEIVQEENPQSECLLCLSSPRQVVLLPCRHLVACKECALNMVEFGAGGNITLPSESGGGDAMGVSGGEGNAAGSGRGGVGDTGALPTATPPATANPRRKKKAKGWFCPVCRQPYTSMLRLTTTAPPIPDPEVHDKGEVSGTEDEDEGEARPSSTGDAATGTGLFGSRGGFLRNLSALGRERDRTADVENQITTRGNGV